MKLNEKYEDFLAFLKQEGRHEKTINEYRRIMFGALSHSIHNIELENFVLNDVAKVIEAGSVHGQFGPQRAVVALRRYLRFLKNGGIRIMVDWRDIPVPKVPGKDPDALTKEELEYVFESIPLTSVVGYRERALLETIYSTGMRISECLALLVPQIPWDTKELKIVNVKSKSEDRIYFTDRCLYWLNQYLSRRRDSCQYVFVASHGYAAMTSCTARNWLRGHFKEVGKKLGKRIVHHLFRRTFVTHLAEGGAHIKQVQYLARHKSERTTIREYIAIDKAKVKEVHRKIMDSSYPQGGLAPLPEPKYDNAIESSEHILKNAQ